MKQKAKYILSISPAITAVIVSGASSIITITTTIITL
jgi:hypothetical protein